MPQAIKWPHSILIGNGYHMREFMVSLQIQQLLLDSIVEASN